MAFDWIVEADEALEVVANSMKFENLKFRMEIQEDSTDGNLIEVNDAGRLIPIGPEYDKHEYVSISNYVSYYKSARYDLKLYMINYNYSSANDLPNMIKISKDVPCCFGKHGVYIDITNLYFFIAFFLFM